jgi:hypothetical protein
MADMFALDSLYADVKARFAAESPSAPVYMPFGWREPSKSYSGSRIAWVPGDPSGNLGRVGPAKHPGRNPRPLATLFELFHCVISANDLTAPENELAQYRAVRFLYDAWVRAVYLAARGTFTIDSASWDVDFQNERRFGASLIVTCSIQAMVPDAAFEGVPVGAEAVIQVSELDVTEQQTISAADVP